MNRRQSLGTLAAFGAALSTPAAAAGKPIQLHVDMEVDPAREKEMLAAYNTQFQPTIRKQPGFVDVKLMKLRTAVAGKAPAGMTYRLLISFETEEQRLKWVATADHQRVWPKVEACLKGQKYIVLLYDLQ
jgi:antibiotic biosynthesis monooxygenase (ABM) superfamily enzyme